MTQLIGLASMIAVLATALLVLYRQHDQLRAQTVARETFIEALLLKALADRRHLVRVPAEKLAKVFELDVRTLPDPKQFNQKPGPHPALQRRRK